jgi:hypothetical protein
MCEKGVRVLVLANTRISSLIRDIRQRKCPLCKVLPNDAKPKCSFLSEENDENKFILDSTPLC